MNHHDQLGPWPDPIIPDVEAPSSSTFVACMLLEHQDAGDKGPPIGCMDENTLRRVVECVAKEQLGSSDCYYAVWEGNPRLPAEWDDAPRYGFEQHSYYTFRLPLLEVPDFAIRLGRLILRDRFLRHDLSVETTALAAAAIPRSPNLLWPTSQLWRTFSDIDGDETEIAGPTSLIECLSSSGHGRS